MGTPKGFSKLTYAATLLVVTALAGCSVGPEEGEGESTSSLETGYGYSSMAGAYKIAVEEATVQDLIPHKVACPSQKNGKHIEQICIQICHVPPGNPDNSHDKVLPLSAIKAHLGHGDYLGFCDASAGELPVDEGSGGGSTDDGNTGGTTDDSSSGDPSSGTTTTDGGSTGEETVPTDPSAEEPSSGDGPTGDSISGGSGDESVPDSGSSSGGDSSSGGETFPDEGTGGSVDDGAGDTADGSTEVPNFCVPYYDIDQNCDGFNDNTGMPYL